MHIKCKWTPLILNLMYFLAVTLFNHIIKTINKNPHFI